jgi:hypothetical protein
MDISHSVGGKAVQETKIGLQWRTRMPRFPFPQRCLLHSPVYQRNSMHLARCHCRHAPKLQRYSCRPDYEKSNNNIISPSFYFFFFIFLFFPSLFHSFVIILRYLLSFFFFPFPFFFFPFPLFLFSLSPFSFLQLRIHCNRRTVIGIQSVIDG